MAAAAAAFCSELMDDFAESGWLWSLWKPTPLSGEEQRRTEKSGGLMGFIQIGISGLATLPLTPSLSVSSSSSSSVGWVSPSPLVSECKMLMSAFSRMG